MRTLSRLLAAACTLPWILWSQQPPAKRALIIGNGGYRQPLPAVEGFRKNARLVDQQLRDLGFKTSFKLDLDQDGMKAETDRFAADIKPGDVVFFYYSGYGMQNRDTNYLLPVSCDPKDDMGLVGQAYRAGYLLEQLEAHKAGLRIVVLDAAWDWPGVPEGNQGLANMKTAMDRTLVSFPALAGKVLKPPAGDSAGRFALALVDALKTPGLKPAELFNTVNRKVSASDAAQQPYSIQPALEDFYFIQAEEPVPTVIYRDKPIRGGEGRQNPKDLLNYIWIPAGTFEMGCVDGDTKCRPDEFPRHTVTISQGFGIAESEVTISAYNRFLNQNPAHRLPKRTQTNYGEMSTELPRTEVTWDDAEDYCKWAGGRLPKEAEWEYAARGGRTGEIYPWGMANDNTKANFFKTKSPLKKKFTETTPVRSYPENGWHLFDMTGNAAEWVQDLHNPDTYKKPGPVLDPLETAGTEHVIRGGNYNAPIDNLRNSFRDHGKNIATNTVGFRCVLPNLDAR